MNRRKFILTVGAGTTVAVAGCSDGGDEGSGGNGGNNADTSSPEGIVESFYRTSDEIGSDASTDEILDVMGPFLHSASPIPDLLEESSGDDSNSEDRSLNSVSTEVIEEDVGEATLAEDYSLGLAGVSESDIAAIAEGNAIVEASVEYDNGDSQSPRHVTATESGDWLIVF